MSGKQILKFSQCGYKKWIDIWRNRILFLGDNCSWMKTWSFDNLREIKMYFIDKERPSQFENRGKLWKIALTLSSQKFREIKVLLHLSLKVDITKYFKARVYYFRWGLQLWLISQKIHHFEGIFLLEKVIKTIFFWYWH